MSEHRKMQTAESSLAGPIHLRRQGFILNRFRLDSPASSRHFFATGLKLVCRKGKHSNLQRDHIWVDLCQSVARFSI
jgi:hypothetical protein